MAGQAGHAAVPEAGSFRTGDGGEADLFTLAHYPVDAVCQVCRGTIRAQSFLRPFEHVEQATEPGPPQAADTPPGRTAGPGA